MHGAKQVAAPDDWGVAFDGQVEVLDLRSLQPYDWEMIKERVAVHNKVLVLTEEAVENSFAQSIAGRIAEECFTLLDAPVMSMGAENLPAIPLNSILEGLMLPNADKVAEKLGKLMDEQLALAMESRNLWSLEG